MSLYSLLLEPFAEFSFMRRALVACFAVGLGSGPIGVLLVLRRMSLVGDALSHAILPGAAIGFLISGFSLLSMSVGGMIAGLSVALMSGVISRMTSTHEDASFAAFYLVSLALGVMIVTTRGSNVDLMHVLFGTILAVDELSLIMLACICTFTLLTLAMIFRPLIMECFDPDFLKSAGTSGVRYHLLFLTLVVLNLVGGFQALGTLMAVGLMMLPAAAAKMWSDQIWKLMILSCFFALLSGFAGLLISFYYNLPSGPSIILVAGALYLASILLGGEGGMIRTLRINFNKSVRSHS